MRARRRACVRCARRAACNEPKPFVLLNHLTEPTAMPRAPRGARRRSDCVMMRCMLEK